MKKFFVGMIMSVASLAMVFANNALSQEELFEATIKEVDMGGLSLQYQNVDDLESIAMAFVEVSAFSNVNANAKINSNPMVKMQVDLAINTLKEVLKKANLNAMQSMAGSVKRVGEDTYLNKTFIYTGANPAGALYDIIGRENKSFDYLKIVPENAVFAFSTHVNMGVIYDALYNNVLKNNPMAVQYIPLLEMQLGMPLADFMKSLSGEYTGFATVAINADDVLPQALIRIPDNAGVLSNFLKMMLGTQEKMVQLPANPKHPSIAPVIVFAEKSIIVATDNATLTQSVEAETSGKNITTNANFAPYKEYLQNSGLSQMFFALDQTQMQLINSLFIVNDINYELKPIFAIVESQVTNDGYKTVMPCSFNLASPAKIFKLQSALVRIMTENMNKLQNMKDLAE